MEKSYTNIIAVFLRVTCLSVLLIVWSSTSCLAQDGEVTEKIDPEQKFQGFNLQGYTDGGDKSWDVKGDTADIQGSEIKIKNVNANSYGEQPMNVTAEYGTVDQLSGKMRLENDVIVTGDDGMQLMTDTLNWDKDQDLVSTDDDVLITDDRLIMTGKGMEAKPGLKQAEIQSDVIVTVDIDPDDEDGGNDKLTITSDGPMVIDQAESMATFDDNVVAVQAQRTLKADHMEVYFDEETQSLIKLICIGNVEIVQGENETYAQKVIYNNAEQKITLIGRPKLILVTEGENAITASGD